jgi:hypothetical protein
MEEEKKTGKYIDTEPEDFFDDYISPGNESGNEIPDESISVPTRKIDISKAFTGSLSSKLKILAEAIEEIDQLIGLRKSLSRLIQERIDKEISNSEYLLSQVKPWQLGVSNSIEMRRLGLEREIIALRKEKRSEDVRSWEHVSTLKKLRRQFVIEYQNLLNTKETLEGPAP